MNKKTKDESRSGEILVVEDDAFTRDLLSQELHDLGHKAVFISNGNEVVKTAKACKPDLILLDIMIPGMDGFSVCRALRKEPETSPIPVIFITAKGGTENVVRGLELGGNDYVTKPIDMPILAARVANQLRSKKLYDQVCAQMSELEILNTRVKEFLGMASHDLRTPTSVIKLIAHTLLDNSAGPLNETQNAFLTKIYNQTTYMNTLLDDLLNMTHIESGKISLRLQQENLNSVLKENLSALKFLADNKGVQLTLDTDASLPGILIDQARFTEIIDNLVSNAIKFTQPGGRIHVRTFASKLSNDADCACISIADSGVGIPPAGLQRIFEKFGTQGQVPGRSEKSTGLGLFIAKKLTELHDGRLEVTSTVGKGTEFVIKLPLRRS